MTNLTIKILPLTDNHFLTTYTSPLTKKKIRKKFLTKKEAQIYKVTIEHQFKKRNNESYNALTVEELICVFTTDITNSPFSKKKVHLIDFIDTFGDLLLNDLTTPMLKSWLTQVQIENKLKDISMRGLKCEIDTFFAYLVKKEIISESPLARIYYKKHVPTLNARNILTQDKVGELLTELYIYSPGYLYPIIKMFAETGAKTSEIVNLSWGDISRTHKSVSLEGAKKGQKRIIQISDELISILSKRLKNSGSVFNTYYKEPFTSKKLSLAINEFKRKTNSVIQWCPADLRHSFAVNFLTEGGDMKDLQVILGHDNVYDTKKLYGEVLNLSITKNAIDPF